MPNFEAWFIELFNVPIQILTKQMLIFVVGLFAFFWYLDIKESWQRRNTIEMQYDLLEKMKVRPPQYAKKTINK